MAITNGASHVNGDNPPPSTMLAAKVVEVDGNLDKDKFDQLLDAVLDSNADVGNDPQVNGKVIGIVTQAGLKDSIREVPTENPFHARSFSGRDATHIGTCLDAIRMAVERAPQAVFVTVPAPDAHGSKEETVYAWLIPKLLSLMRDEDATVVTRSALAALDACLMVDSRCSQTPACGMVRDYLTICLRVMIDHIHVSVDDSPHSKLTIDGTKYDGALHKFGVTASAVESRIVLQSRQHALYIAIKLLSLLSQSATCQKSKLLVQKQAQRLQKLLVVDEHSEQDAHFANLVRGLTTISLDGIFQETSHHVDDKDGWRESDRATKRLRLSLDGDIRDGSEPVPELYRKVSSLLTGQARPDLDGLSRLTPTHFKALSTEDQVIRLETFENMTCALAGSKAQNNHCLVCNGNPEIVDFCLSSNDGKEILDTLMNLLGVVSRNQAARIVVMSAIRKVLLHTSANDAPSLSHSSTGEWCLQALRSTSRDLRIATIRTLQVFTMARRGVDSDLVHENRVTALSYLQNLWDKAEMVSKETAVLALTQMAEVMGDEELNIILLRLIEYLGHPNPYLSGVVYTEIQRLALCFHMAVANLFRPFWRTLSVVIIKHFVSRPSIVQHVAELLGLQVDGLLLVLEPYALPYLVQNQQQPIIERMAAAHSGSTSPYILCMERKNIINILSYLLAEPSADPQETIMNLLISVSNEFAEYNVPSWIGQYPTQIACELLKAIGDAADGKASRHYRALQILAQLLSKTGSSSRKHSVASFLETHARGIVSDFTVVLNETEAIDSDVEKRRCLAGLGEVVKLGKSRVSSALPQTSACLRSAMANPKFCNIAFSSWAVMVSALNNDDVNPLIEQSLAIIRKTWSMLDGRRRQEAQKLVDDVVHKHGSIVKANAIWLPSLADLPGMDAYEDGVREAKQKLDERQLLSTFVQRLKNENMVVVEQAFKELVALLPTMEDFLHKSILQEQPDVLVAELARAIVDACFKFGTSTDVLTWSGQCLGVIGCFDPNRLENIQEKRTLIMKANFGSIDETIEFIFFLFENVLVKAFLSAQTSRAQGFLGWAMQEILERCSVQDAVGIRPREDESNTASRRWNAMPEETRNVLTPFLTSKYQVKEARPREEIHYPIFQNSISHATWLRTLTLDLLQRATSGNTELIFDVCCRIVHGQDISIPTFLLPYAVMNLVINGTESDKEDIITELGAILQSPLSGCDRATIDEIHLCSQSVFDVLDYMSKWVQEKRRHYNVLLARLDRGIRDPSMEIAKAQIDNVEQVHRSIPPDVLSGRAIECRSYARALFHWEQHLRRVKMENHDEMLERLQEIYAQIDEPDGIEGIAAEMTIVNVEQEVLEHQKAGRWTAAQSWYEMQLSQKPNDVDVQVNLLNCLEETGQHDVLLHHYQALTSQTHSNIHSLAPFAIEAAWATNNWTKVELLLQEVPSGDYNTSIAKGLLDLKNENVKAFEEQLVLLCQSVTATLNLSTIVSLQAAHEAMFKAHVIEDIRQLSKITADTNEKTALLQTLQRRLDVLGSYTQDKRFALGVQRAAMSAMPMVFTEHDIATSWLTSARLARKAGANNQAFSAVIRAAALGEKAASIEQAKLMWREGYHRKAIKTLEGAIASGAFKSYETAHQAGAVSMTDKNKQNPVTSKAYALLGKWLDQAGQTQSEDIIKTFRLAIKEHGKSEKAWYFLGRHQNKILDIERLKASGKETEIYLTGELLKLTIESYLRAAWLGTKYVFQSLPKALTLWLELLEKPSLDAKKGSSKFQQHILQHRKKVVSETNDQFDKYGVKRIPAVVLYTILPQMIARICHSEPAVYNILSALVVKVVRSFPQQALWTLLAVQKSKNKDRQARGLDLQHKVAEAAKKSGKDGSAAELRALMQAGQKFTDEILRVSDFPIEGKVAKVSLTKDLGFNHKITPSKLAVPVEACLIPNIPSSIDIAEEKSFRPFAQNTATISSFLDEALVLASLQKPRKLTIRGSDGNLYGILAKPKDDMRKDQRLMEFNTMINRFLKRDVEASKRRLYIRTYAVIPLNEECGLIEWVNNLKTFRDIILKLYKDHGVTPNYTEIRTLLDEASQSPEKAHTIFLTKVLPKFPPVFHEYFVESFPDPSAWFTARLRFTRSAAVMSMIGNILGLGDRHGENILFEEDNGGTLHVDFNCLFDKGLTFEKPEMVPFRLTHNMIDAMGSYRYNGPFRRCCEITLTLLRGNQDALMTILETFLHDPTTDFVMGGKGETARKKGKSVEGVPDSPQGILDSVQLKVKGYLGTESVPLSVAGYVEEMIKRATDEWNLARMYIGWCAFF